MHFFDSDISLVREGPLRFRGNVSGNWSVNGSPNGGYLVAISRQIAQFRQTGA